jgi:alpha-galactosidase
MKKVFMIIAAMCMTSIMASAQKTIRVSTDKTDLVMQVSPKGRLYQVYLGDKLKNPSDYNHLKWDIYATSLADGTIRGRIYIPLQLIVIRRILQLVTQIHLVEATLRRNLHHEVGLVG